MDSWLFVHPSFCVLSEPADKEVILLQVFFPFPAPKETQKDIQHI